jgi:SAM-dependent methyltransferase
MSEFWNERYATDEYAYGVLPNEFLKSELSKLTPGTILFPADGEGRNGVYAAKQGWTVFAYDVSIEGRKKAQQLAEKNGVIINYSIHSFEDMPYRPNQFDAIALVYSHFPSLKRPAFHKALISLMKPGGIFILEAFSKNNIEYVTKNEKVGGPRDIDMLYSVGELQKDFSSLEIIKLDEEVVALQEGLYHNGTGAVVRFVARKR